MSNNLFIRTGIGQDSHRFLTSITDKPCILGGLVIEKTPGFEANSDGDVIFHAICNAISSVTGIIILGEVADKILAEQGVSDSRVYLEEALKALGNQKITHVALTIEALIPKLLKKIPKIRRNIADVMNLHPSQVGITATTGEGLTAFGRGQGVQCFCIITTIEDLIE